MPLMTDIRQLDALVLDLDGVIYRGDRVIPGAAETVEIFRQAGLRVVFATNNATRSPASYSEKLGAMGIPAEPSDIVTAAVVTAEEVVRRGWAERGAFLIGGESMRETLGSAGVRLVEGEAAERADLVIVSADRSFTYDKLRTAGLALHRGAGLIATNADATFPAADGLWPGAGALVAAVETVAGRRAEVMGKPHPPMMKAIERRLEGCRRIAMVGDQPATDLAGASSMGWMTILVLSGVTGEDAVRGIDPPPDLVLPDLPGLARLGTGSRG